MREIKLSQNKFAIVDDEDYGELSKYKWYFTKDGRAVRSVKSNHNTWTPMYMHIQIVGKIEGLVIDHINGNPLDNRRNNLRHVTKTQNAQNSKSHKNTSSKYKGVSWNKEKKRWLSTICISKKRYILGYYKSELDAAYVYNVWAESFFGEYVKINVLEI